MENMKNLVGTAVVLAALGLPPASLSTARAATGDRLQLAMMDEMNMKSNPSSGSSTMGQSGSQSQNMGGMGGGMGRMGGMGGAGGMGGMPMQSPMGGMGQSGGQSQNMGGGMDNMMQMMRMMHGQMTSPPKAGTAPDAGVAASGPADVTERLEGRIAFLKAELQITDKQAADWSLLADALRSGRQHLLDARKLLVVDDKISGSERIEHYERHLAERLEAIKAARTAFNRLYGNLSDDQKKTADSILLPLIATF